jgi:hypothetical protein
LGLLEPIQQFIDSKDPARASRPVEGADREAAYAEANREKECPGQVLCKESVEKKSRCSAVAGDMARICSAESAQKVRQLTLANDTGLIDAREELRVADATCKAKDASDAAWSAKQRAKEAVRRRGVPSSATGAGGHGEAAVGAANLAPGLRQRTSLRGMSDALLEQPTGNSVAAGADIP